MKHGLAYTRTITNIIFVLATMMLALNAVDISSCQTLNAANTDYHLTQNINANGTCFQITAPHIRLFCDGYSITGNGNGAAVQANTDADYAYAKDCKISNFENGIYFDGVFGGVIWGDNISISSESGSAVLLANSTNESVVSQCDLYAQNNAVMIMSSSAQNDISQNTIKAENEVAVNVADSYGNHVEGNKISAYTMAVFAVNSPWIYVHENGVSAQYEYGIYTRDSPHGYIESNNASALNHAIHIHNGSDYSTIENNIATAQNYYAIYVYADSNTISGNIANAANSTILVDTSNNNYISSNSADASEETSMFIYFSNTTTMQNNNFSGYDYPVYLMGGNRNTLNANNIGARHDYALYLDASSQNIMTSNYLESGSKDLYIDSNSGSNKFYGNEIAEGEVYVTNLGTSNSFNTTVGSVAQGNRYGNIEYLAIYDANDDGFGDSGAKYPCNAANFAGKWIGSGADYGPVLRQKNISSCAQLKAPNMKYLLTKDINTNSSCFNITAKNVTIDGQGHAITCAGSCGYGVYSNQNYTDVKNLNINGFGAGIEFSGAGTGIISNNQIQSPGPGSSIKLEGSDFANVSENYVNSQGKGIALFDSSYGSVAGNHVSSESFGLEAHGGNANIFGSNQVSCTSYCVALNQTQNLDALGNTISSAAGPGLYAEQSPYLEADENEISSPNSAMLYSSPNAKITYNKFTSNGGTGLTLATGSSSAQVWYNKFYGSGAYVSNSESSNSFYKGSSNSKGNYYANIRTRAISDSNSDGYGDTGAQYPYKASTSGGKWLGSGEDRGPKMSP